MHIAKLMLHPWEEEPISGVAKGYKGTFAIFFYGCNMRCVYCQNSKISHVTFPHVGASYASPLAETHVGEKQTSELFSIMSPDDLSNEMLLAEHSGAATISFITGVLYIDKIVETIKLARKKGLTLPIVYNSSGFEPVSQIKKLKNLIDIYLPDFKYIDNSLAKTYSNASNYVEVAKACISEMYNQVGLDNLIIRHLVLPSHTEDAKKIIKYLYDTYSENVTLSILSQYTPMLKNEGIERFPELHRKLTKREYDKVINYILSLNMQNVFIQDLTAANYIYIPDF